MATAAPTATSTARRRSNPNSGGGAIAKASRSATPARTWLFLAVAAVVGLWLAVQVVTVAMARRYAADEPQLALAWRSDYAPALAALAEHRSDRAMAAPELREARALAERALAHGPLEVRAIRVLGLASEQLGDSAGAAALLSEAGRRSQREGPAHMWLFRQAMKRQDYPAAFRHADALMRKPVYRSTVEPQLVAAALDPAAVGALVARLGHNPPWRSSVIQDLARTAPGAAFEVLLGLTGSSAPPTDAEVAQLVERVAGAGHIEQAYVMWAQLLPPAGVPHLANVYDGGFEGLVGAPPFNWRVTTDQEASAQITQGPDGDGQALYARFGAGAPVMLAEQLLLLPPARYRVSIRAYAEEPNRGDQLLWMIGCAATPFRPLTELKTTDEALVWRGVSAVVELPAQGCEAQSLRLIGRAGDLPGFARAWFDQVTVERIP
jgi:hypothetical protein